MPNWAAAFIAGYANDDFMLGGWEEKYFSELDMSFLVPTGHLEAGNPSETFVNLNHTASSLGYSISIGDPPDVLRFHEYTVGRAVPGTEPYTVRKSDLWISSVRTPEGMTLYTRSDYRRGRWSTLLLSAADADSGILAAVTGSIRTGVAPPIYFPDGVLSRGWQKVEQIIAEEERREASASAASEPPKASGDPTKQPEGASGTGTGFVVSSTGHVLTNEHVVSGCRNVTVDGEPARVLASDEGLDLALLQSTALSGAPVAVFAANPAMLNADVTVVGYPLAGLLGGLNVTRGALTSLKGLAGDTNTMQISAPVQPGNSGGPVLNSDGQIVGVVVSKLDAQFVSEAIGDIPQNVNFAIRGEIAKLFLAQNSVLPVTLTPGDRPTPEQLAQTAIGYTKFIECK